MFTLMAIGRSLNGYCWEADRNFLLGLCFQCQPVLFSQPEFPQFFFFSFVSFSFSPKPQKIPAGLCVCAVRDGFLGKIMRPWFSPKVMEIFKGVSVSWQLFQILASGCGVKSSQETRLTSSDKILNRLTYSMAFLYYVPNDIRTSFTSWFYY